MVVYAAISPLKKYRKETARHNIVHHRMMDFAVVIHIHSVFVEPLKLGRYLNVYKLGTVTSHKLRAEILADTRKQRPVFNGRVGRSCVYAVARLGLDSSNKTLPSRYILVTYKRAFFHL